MRTLVIQFTGQQESTEKAKTSRFRQVLLPNLECCVHVHVDKRKAIPLQYTRARQQLEANLDSMAQPQVHEKQK